MRDIVKTYGKVLANDGVSIRLNKGEILAIVGENGAGKSTLMKILYGLEKPDSGSIFLNGQEMHWKNPSDAMKQGIGMVQQHFMLFESMTVTENIIYNNEARKSIFLDRRKNTEKVQEISEKYMLKVDPDAIVGDCPVGTQQRVEILKTLYQNADIIIFDEPSAVLTPAEVDELLKTMKRLSEMGKSIIIITHKLNEVMAVSDSVVVMRDGKKVAETRKEDTTIEELSFLAVGRHIEAPVIEPRETTPGLLEVGELTLVGDSGKTLLDNVNIHVDYGEIVGIAGVSGNGQSELAKALTGLQKNCHGSVKVQGKEMINQTVATFRTGGVAHIPEDRYAWGSAPEATLYDNAMMGEENKPPIAKHGVLNIKKAQNHAAGLIEEYAVRASSVHQKIKQLSGGNAQKLIAAREIDKKTSLLIACEPTRGIDVGAMDFIHDKLLEKRNQGDGILLISSELSEITKLSDRIYVIYEGAIKGEFVRGMVSERELGLLMAGGEKNENRE